MRIHIARGKLSWLHLSTLLVVICVAYGRLVNAPFFSWDDKDYVFHTADISSGIGWAQIKNWFTHYYIGNYQPLPVFTYALDHLIGGSNPVFYHVDNVIWHIADAWLVYLFVKRIQYNIWVAFPVALLFALHPVQAESVSWIGARNKGMNTFFYLLSMLAYCSYSECKTYRKLAWVYVWCVMAYLCKATAISLPLALFAVDIWRQRPLNNKRVWLEKIPMIALAIPIICANIQAQKQINFLWHHGSGVTFESTVLAGYAYTRYIIELLLPFRLSVLYPYPPGISSVHELYFILAAGVAALMIVAYRKKWFMLAGGILFFTANLLPVLQFVQFGDFLMADRYLYTACIGIFLPVVFYIIKWSEKYQRQALGVGSLCCASLVFLCITFIRNDMWLSDLNFFNALADDFPKSSVAQYSLGALYMDSGNYPQAEVHIDKAVLLDSRNYKAWYNKGVLSLREQKVAVSLDAFNKCLSIAPYPEAYFSRALIFMATGRLALALSDAETTLKFQPLNARAWYIKGYCNEQQGDAGLAISDYSNAIKYESTEPLFYTRRGIAYSTVKQYYLGITDLDRAISLDPANGQALYYRGMMKCYTGQSPCSDFHSALAHGYKIPAGIMQQKCK